MHCTTIRNIKYSCGAKRQPKQSSVNSTDAVCYLLITPINSLKKMTKKTTCLAPFFLKALTIDKVSFCLDPTQTIEKASIQTVNQTV